MGKLQEGDRLEDLGVSGVGGGDNIKVDLKEIG